MPQFPILVTLNYLFSQSLIMKLVLFCQNFEKNQKTSQCLNGQCFADDCTQFGQSPVVSAKRMIVENLSHETYFYLINVFDSNSFKKWVVECLAWRNKIRAVTLWTLLDTSGNLLSRKSSQRYIKILKKISTHIFNLNIGHSIL